MRRTAILAAGALALAAAPALGAFSPAQTVARSGTLGDTALATSPNGAAVLVWRDGRPGGEAIRVADRQADGTWGPAQEVVTERDFDLSLGGATIDARGRVTVVWSLRHGSQQVAQASTRDGGRWGAVVTLSRPMYAAPLVTADRAGRTVVAWAGGRLRRMPETGMQVDAAIRTGQGRWRLVPALARSRTPGSVRDVRLWPQDDGSVAATWQGAQTGTFTATLPAGALRWSPPRRRAGGPRLVSRVAVAGNGLAAAVTVRYRGRRGDHAVLLDPLTGPSVSRALGALGPFDTSQIALGPGGGVVAYSRTARDYGGSTLFGRLLTASGRLGAPFTLQRRPAPPGGQPTQADNSVEAIPWSPAALVTTEGTSVVAWSEARVDAVQPITWSRRLMVATAGPDGVWTTPAELAQFAEEIPAPVSIRLAPLPGGRVLASWIERDPTGTAVLRTTEGP